MQHFYNFQMQIENVNFVMQFVISVLALLIFVILAILLHIIELLVATAAFVILLDIMMMEQA